MYKVIYKSLREKIMQICFVIWKKPFLQKVIILTPLSEIIV